MMENKTFLQLAITVVSVVFVVACAAIQGGYAPPLSHPEIEGEDLRYCTECHDSEEAKIPVEKFSHDMFFAEKHNQVAGQYGNVCAMCHRGSFCSDCHGAGVELKPSIKNRTENYRRMPHRGDYRSRHFIDGRINPTSCFRCHGNPKSSLTCKACHG